MTSKSVPLHPGKILYDQVMVPLGVSRNKLARDIDVPVGRISDIVNGKRGVTPDTALRLACYFGTEAELWMRLQWEYDLYVARSTTWPNIAPRVRVFDPNDIVVQDDAEPVQLPVAAEESAAGVDSAGVTYGGDTAATEVSASAEIADADISEFDEPAPDHDDPERAADAESPADDELSAPHAVAPPSAVTLVPSNEGRLGDGRLAADEASVSNDSPPQTDVELPPGSNAANDAPAVTPEDHEDEDLEDLEIPDPSRIRFGVAND